MKFLFLKRSLSWPRGTGHDVHTYHMALALAGLGHAIEFATVVSPAAVAVAGLPLADVFSLSTQQGVVAPRSPMLSWLQRRYLRYWGIDRAWIDATAAIVSATHPDVVVACGLDVMPCLAGVRGAVRVWYAADEFAFHHLSMLKPLKLRSWRHAFDAAVAGMYERAYAHHIDRIWVVSRDEQRAMRRVSGVQAVDIAPNGVDGDHFQPGDEPQIPRSCAFWGRLDAGPNIQAVEWFCRHVWPTVRQSHPDAQFTAFGFNPVAAVRAWAGRDGISVVADAPDLRPELRRRELAVMPFVSGGGIKNKVLEAAALGLPVVGSPLAFAGLHEDRPLMVARTPGEWGAALQNLWSDADARLRLGAEARRWVLEYHSWDAAAEAVLDAACGFAVRAGTP